MSKVITQKNLEIKSHQKKLKKWSVRLQLILIILFKYVQNKLIRITHIQIPHQYIL